MRARIILSLAMVFLIAAALGCVSGKAAGAPDKKDLLAQCLTEKGAKMYGSYKCPHCQDQKKEFGTSWQYVNYVECLPPAGKGQTKVCEDAGIQRYPTWIINGAKYEGKIELITLAKISGCAY